MDVDVVKLIDGAIPPGRHTEETDWLAPYELLPREIAPHEAPEQPETWSREEVRRVLCAHADALSRFDDLLRGDVRLLDEAVGRRRLRS